MCLWPRCFIVCLCDHVALAEALSVVRLGPANTQSELSASSPVLFNCSFSERVVGISPSLFDVSASTASIANVTVSANASAWTIVTVAVKSSGLVRLAINAPSGVVDAATQTVSLSPSNLVASVQYGTKLSVTASCCCKSACFRQHFPDNCRSGRCCG